MRSNDEVLRDLDRRLGPPAVMDLLGRTLLVLPAAPAPGLKSAGGGLTDPAAPLLGAAVGNALGRPVRYLTRREIRGEVRGFRPWSGWRHGPTGTYLAEVQDLRLYAQAWAADPRTPWSEFGRRLARKAPLLRDPGSTVLEAAGRLGRGAPWYAAGDASYGGAAILRSAVDAAVFPDDRAMRTASASIAASITHAHRRAVVASAVAADAIARFAAEPDLISDPGAATSSFAELCPTEPIAARLRALGKAVARRRPDLPEDVSPEAEAVLLAALTWVFTTDSTDDALLGAANGGGATHLVAGLAGAMAAAARGRDGLRRSWLGDLEHGADIEQEGHALSWASLMFDGEGRPEPDPSPVVSGALTSPTTDAPAPSHIWFLLDRTGSMATLAGAVIKGFRTFLEDQREAAPSTVLTLVQFDSMDPHETVIDALPVREVVPLRPDQFEPRASTPLYDAIGLLVRRIDRHIADGADHADQLVVIFTDGLENASERYRQRDIFKLIDDRTKRGWEFAFLGANQDSFATGGSIGVHFGSSANWEPTEEGTLGAFHRLGASSQRFSSSSHRERRMRRGRFFG